MNKNKNRRNFLSRSLLAAGAAFSLPFISWTKAGAKEQEEKTKDMNSHPVIRTKALGFQWETSDPFLFCVHHEDKFPKGNALMGPDPNYFKGRHMGEDFIIKDGFRMYHGRTVPGFPGHPHRGFETITVVREGVVDHADSLGAAGRYGDGDVQWMTAGKGVQHSEMFPLIHQDRENPMELFQIWLNLPKKSKMVEPHFKMLWRETIPIYQHKDNNGKETKVEVIAGKIAEHQAPDPPPNSWAAEADNEVAVWNLKMEAGATWTLPKAIKGINRTLYFYQGENLSISGQKILRYHAVELLPEIETILSAETATSILILQGRPIGEPVIQYGPFVMNTKEEIHQAFDDYHRSKFGGWPWPKYDQVHARHRGRFALHADGKEEIKGA